MSGSGRERRSTERNAKGSHHGVMRALAAMLPWRMAAKIREFGRRSDRIEERLDGIEGRLDGLGEAIGGVSERQDLGESTLRTLQDLLEKINTVRLSDVDRRMDQLSEGLGQASDEITRLRDGLIPAAEGRWNALFERLAFELEEIASLVERILASEPLPVFQPGSTERELSQGLNKVQPLLVEAFRGSEAEISHRMESVLPLLVDHAPVLDLGCGRGELLVLLREAGVDARGIESDGALVQGALRRGLDVDQADILEALRASDAESVGAITAFHVFEHFSGLELSEVLNECRRVLRPGGTVVVECPNPHNLRVGAALFWQDPTHVRPLLPETLTLFFKAAGMSIQGLEFLHPFPEEQHLRAKDPLEEDRKIDHRLDRLEKRLDDLMNGPRDFRMVAVKK
jgi:O-antigen chain-terminating methyltransferase